MNTNKKSLGLTHVLLVTGMLAVASISLPVAAQSDDGEERQQGKRRGPPPEAIEACADLSEGESCAFSGRRGDMTGVCFAPPKDDAELACAPEGGRPGRREREEDSGS
ncbi:hypothetical protein R0135_13750 [Congregibacter variabilis]|uniref:Uncharacterized protein n=1 Tax=Congregibacter variabilis TaxID=3081200 RepID=A0ABZ0I1B7_9GAMM|nr:hypothetical protein R0135_13750 [Congregibacter sp. IMCC43200]